MPTLNVCVVVELGMITRGADVAGGRASGGSFLLSLIKNQAGRYVGGSGP